MSMRDTDVETLAALRAAQNEHPALEALLGFYSELYEIQYRAKPSLPEPWLWEPAARRQRLEAGLPQLTFDRLRLDEPAFRSLLHEVTGLLRRHDPAGHRTGNEAADSRPPVGVGEPWAADTPIAQARSVFDSWDTLTEPAPEAQRAVAFALAPYLQRAADILLPELDLAAWVWARCPVCGGQPNLALLDP